MAKSRASVYDYCIQFLDITVLMSNTPHILIADDDSLIRTNLARFLAANGFRVSTAEDGIALSAAMENGRFDLVVLDIMMPGEDGLSLCRRFRGRARSPLSC